MSGRLGRRVGFELELLAPRGSSRRTLADSLARGCGGSVRGVWHPDSEPAPIRSLGGRFLHLTQGFDVVAPDGDLLCTLVDDVTIVADLDATAAAPPGWHRILTDDPRLLSLLARVSSPAGPIESALDGAAALWGAEVERRGNVLRLDTDGATIALATPAGGERERPCEIVTPPVVADHADALERLLAPARALGFTLPQEAAVHMHVDGRPFREAPALANVVLLFGLWREPLRRLLGTNAHCRRLAPLPDDLIDAARHDPTIDGLRAAAKAGGLSKFFDVNLTQLLRDDPVRDTLEIRILPGALHAEQVMAGAVVVDRLLDHCLEVGVFPDPPPVVDDAVVALRQLADSTGVFRSCR